MSMPTSTMLLTRAMQAHCFSIEHQYSIALVTRFRPAWADTLSDETMRNMIEGAQIAVTGWGTPAFSRDLLDCAPELKLVCHSAGSIKPVLGSVADEFRRRRIRVCSAASALAVGVAEYAFGLMLISMKAGWQYHAATHQGRWNQTEYMEWIREPFGATIGIVGASFVGREMIRLCSSLRLKAILLYDPYVSEEEAARLGVHKADLDDLMRRSDVVSLHTPATEETRHLLNARNLALLKDHAILINTARGLCIDEEALAAELKTGRILACLDVTYPKEPPAPDSPLYTLANCILTPHIAGALKENTYRQGELVARQIASFVKGEALPGEIDLSQLDHIA